MKTAPPMNTVDFFTFCELKSVKCQLLPSPILKAVILSDLDLKKMFSYFR